MAINGKTKFSQLHHRGEFLHNYYMFESMNNTDHDSVVRTFPESCEVSLIIYLHYVERFQFFYYQECNEQLT